jgi:hypothetical protein
VSINSDKQKFCDDVQRNNEGVYCPYVGAYVPPSYCRNSCKKSGKVNFIGTLKRFHHRSSSGCCGEKTIQPFPKNNEEFNKDRFKINHAVAAEMAKNSGKAVVTEAIFVERRQKCAICPPEDKQGCPCVGCKQWNKLIFLEMKCPLNKWPTERKILPISRAVNGIF